MKILIVGSGGREHAIAASVAKSPRADKIYCAPGNAGIAEYAECVDIGAMEFEKLAEFAKEKEIDLCIVGMDDPLVGGLVDVLEDAGIRTFGPKKNAAILEGSKAFSKDLMKKYDIPTAGYENFTDPKEAIAYLENAKFPIVLKADGLALGKGVLICQNFEEAKEGVKTIMLDKKFGTAGNEMVIEEFMTGREVSVLSFVDGKTIKTMTSAQDHKRAGDGDTGLNTGGMGTFSPSPFYTKEVEEFCEKYIYQRTVDAMAAEGRPFKGVIFFGLMLTEEGPKVLEYNARFGDPEAQVVLPRMKNDILDVVEACVDGTLDQIDLQFEDNAAVCVVLASEGYPVQYEKGYPITGLEEFSKQYPEQVTIIKNDPPQGSAKDNFISLIQNSYGPHFMFCDQDDVWKPDKIYLTLQKMEALEARYGEKTPILVHSDLSVADHNLEMVAESFFQYANIPKRIVLNQLMVQNSVTGCTMMINRCLQQYFLRPLPMSKIIMHDYWAALIAKVFGKIGFVNEPTMYYRQHGNNSVGAKDAKNPVFLYHRLKEGKNSYRRMMIESMEQMQGFVETYGEEIDNLDVYELLESYGELYYKGKIKRLSFYKNHHVLKEGNIRKLMQWLWG